MEISGILMDCVIISDELTLLRNKGLGLTRK